MKSPCQNCTERSTNCHASCEKYKAFARECKRIREAGREIFITAKRHRRFSLWKTNRR